MRVREAAGLPAVLADPAEFQLGPAWFAALTAAALPAGAAPLVLVAEDARGTPRLALPLLRHADGTRAGLTAPYTSVFRPLAAADATAAECHAAGRAFAAACRGAGPLRLDALDAAWPGLAPLLAGFRAGGMLALRFAHFANWHAEVAGQDWAAWLAARPGALRSTIRRRLARAAREAALAVEIARDGAGLAAAYDAVYAQSWKDPEPYPRFPAALIEAAAATGALRLGLLRAGGVPVAAQIWTVAGGTATVHKLAHAEAARAHSPGTVLTAHMIRHLLDAERVAALDFGRGDDPYKAAWTGARRMRIGVLLCPPWQAAGAAAIARHLGGRLRALLASVTETR